MARSTESLRTHRSPPEGQAPPGGLRPSDARLTGLFYLALVVTGVLSFLVIRPMIFDPGDPAATMAAVADSQPLARAGVALELATATTQALCALWFYRIFRAVDTFLAGAIAIFGMVNAVAILASAAMLATALDLVLSAGTGAAPATAFSQTLYLISENLWMAGNVFFGLWLIPMGLVARRSGWTPRVLPQLLVLGGILYTANAFIAVLAPTLPQGAEVALTAPATAAELWMLGWLLWRGARRAHSEPHS
ncbi:DUF4386 domain-containing protein [Nesterenkonia sp. K-15-9-6]|uniref:DUF4386 domain-containing protein n=1 Tax=Nesterenkonia sp. K-15-9-6 TaxID=3093918 RepID=UPI004044A341